MAVDGASTEGGGAGSGASAPANEPPSPPAPLTFTARVALTVMEETNALVAPLITVASFHLGDVHFEFDSAFPLPDACRPLTQTATLRGQHPGALVSLFGHADPVGDAATNKKLSGRRARALYGALLRDTDLWTTLGQEDKTGDDWAKRPVQVMLDALGFDPGPHDGVLGKRTQEALKAFQTSKGLPATGSLNPGTRTELYAAYMDLLCVDASGAPFTLTRNDFLGQGEDPDGKADVQGCSEFNPLRVFSRAETTRFSQAAGHPQRDFENAPNRRVTIFLFRPGTTIDLAKWPCPKATEGPADCKKRFWSDGEKRLQPGPARREQDTTHDTYACRFYERLTLSAPPTADDADRDARVRGRWSKRLVTPDHNASFPPTSPPADPPPEDAKVELLVETRGVPDGVDVTVEVKHAASGAAVPAGKIEGLKTKGGQVIDPATDKPPVFVFRGEHQPYELFDKPYFFFTATVAAPEGPLSGDSPKDFVGQEADVLRVSYWHLSVSDAIADTPAGGGLTTQDEMNEIANLCSLEATRKVGTVAFNLPNVPINVWGSVLRNGYGYHHASHGDVRCRVDGQQFNSSNDSFPTVCPANPAHPGRSTIFLGNTPLGDAEVSNAAAVPSVPRYFVYLDTCVAGFEPSFANAFIARGTRNVLAFRKYIPDDDARELARQFYRKWIQTHKGDPAKIPDVFFSIAPKFFDSMRPVLFGAGGGAATATVATAVGQALGGIV